jgi:transposase
MGTVQGKDRNQLYLAPSLEDSISGDNFVRIIDALVDAWDLERLGFVNVSPASVGRPSYAAKDMLKLYIYGYFSGIRSSRKLESELGRNVELMWLLRDLRPDHKTIAEFRRKNPQALENTFRAFVTLLDDNGMLGKRVIAVDGTKIRAQNNKKRNMSKKNLARKIKHLDDKISTYMKDLDANDREEDNIPKVDVQALLATLQERKSQYESYQQELEDSGENEKSLTDPDARLMGNNRGGVDVCYNVQTAVDAKHHIIVEMNVTNNPSDHGQLSVMCKQIRKSLKIKFRRFVVLADKGYYNATDLKLCRRYRITPIVARQKAGRGAPDPAYDLEHFQYDKEADFYTCPQGIILKRTGTKASRLYANKKACSDCEHRGKCTTGKHRRVTVSNDQGVYDYADRLFEKNKELYRMRQMLVEHPLGTIKHTMGAGYFLLRTMKKVRGEVALLFLGYNLRRAINVLGFDGMMRAILASPLASLLTSSLNAILRDIPRPILRTGTTL